MLIMLLLFLRRFHRSPSIAGVLGTACGPFPGKLRAVCRPEEPQPSCLGRFPRAESAGVRMLGTAILFLKRKDPHVLFRGTTSPAKLNPMARGAVGATPQILKRPPGYKAGP